MESLTPRSLDSFHSRKTLKVEGKDYKFFSLPDAEANGLPGIAALPYSLKVLLENLLRFEDGRTVTADDIRAMAEWLLQKSSTREIAFRPARVLMQDFTLVERDDRTTVVRGRRELALLGPRLQAGAH